MQGRSARCPRCGRGLLQRELGLDRGFTHHAAWSCSCLNLWTWGVLSLPCGCPAQRFQALRRAALPCGLAGP
eukprot:939922-Alexandrium_andersonii.AAC.1